MSFPELVSGGAGCGPSNPLQNLGKRFGQDRSTQLDQFGANGPLEQRGESSHRATFRSYTTPNHPSDPSFFQSQANPAHSFDLAPLKGTLPFAPPVGPQGAHLNADLDGAWNQRQGSPSLPPEHFESSFPSSSSHLQNLNPGWASDFHSGSNNGVAQHRVRENSPSSFQHVQANGHRVTQPIMPSSMGRFNMMGMKMGAAAPPSNEYMSGYQTEKPQQIDKGTQVDQSKWDSAFTAYDTETSQSRQDAQRMMENVVAPPSDHQEEILRPESQPHEADELARTAGKLVSTVEHETNDKFKKSNFLSLMRKIRDKQAGIQGSDIVETSGEASNSVSEERPNTLPALASTVSKGKGREMPWRQDFRERMGREPESEQEAYRWAKSTGSDSQSARFPPSLQHSLASGQDSASRMAINSNTSLEHEMEGRKELNDLWAEEDARSEAIEREAMLNARRAFNGDGGDVELRRREDEAELAKYQRLGAGTMDVSQDHWTGGMEEDFDQLHEEDFVGRRWEGTRGRGVRGSQNAEWDTLQNDWDAWQAGSAGFKPSMDPPASAARAPQYRFHLENPYVGAASSAVPSTSNIPADIQTVLEREAAVQMDPNNASAWFDLGVKQQENERESAALAALHRAIQLDPTLRDAWLALAVSYTNENDRMSAFEAIERWIAASPEYNEVVKQFRTERGEVPSTASQGYSERHEILTNMLIALARYGSTQNKIDADVQVALGVLFNSSEDYDKAVDCFTAALSVRPDDWLLYNRLGATLSNSGRSEEALGYYHQALDLRPGFVRCHFNLSISCLNLKMYHDAATHIFTALTLQSEAMDKAPSTSLGGQDAGVTSNSLWETLRVACELMGRPDLAAMTASRDIDQFDAGEFLAREGAVF